MTAKTTHALAWAFVLVAALFLQHPASAQQEFIVTGDKIVNSQLGNEFLRISERLPISQLQRRFSRYQVRSTAGEGCLICAVISRGQFGFEVHYDEDGIVVARIFCRDPLCADPLGSRTGGSLRRAIGQDANCSAGEETTCRSARLSGLSYIVREDENCQLQVAEDRKPASIPTCARIAGFIIAKP